MSKTIIATLAGTLLLLAGPAAAQPEPAPEPAPAPAPELAPAQAVDQQPSSPGLVADPSVAPIGVGLGFTIAGTAAALAHKYLNPRLGIQAGLGFEYLNYSGINSGGMDVDGDLFEVTLVAYGVYRLHRLGDVGINAVGGLEFGYATLGSAAGDVSGVDIRLAGGGQLEWFLLPRLSVWAQSGLTLALLGDVGAGRASGTFPSAAADTSAFLVQIGPSTLTQMFGMTWWLP